MGPLVIDAPSTRGACLLLGGLIVGAATLALLIVNFRWSYLVACLAFWAFLYLVLVAKAFDMALVAYLASLLYVQILIRGELEIHGITVGFSEIVLLVLGFAYTLGRGTRRFGLLPRNRAIRHFTCIYGVYAAFMLVSLFYHLEPLDAARVWITFVLETYVVFCMAAYLFTHEDSLRRFVVCLLLFSAIFAFDESGKILAGRPLLPTRYEHLEAYGEEYSKAGLTAPQIYPLLGWPARSAAFMIAFLPLALLPWMGFGGPRLRVLGVLCVAAMVLNLVVLRDRGGWIGAVASLSLMGYFTRRRGLLVSAYAVVGCAVILSVLLGVVTPTVPAGSLADWARELARTERPAIWLNILRALPTVPPIVGIGWSADLFDSFMLSNASVGYGQYGATWRLIHTGFRHPHNSYLQVLLYAGFPAFVAYLAAVAYAYFTILGSLRAHRDSLRSLVAAAIAAGGVAILVESIADLTLWHPVFAAIFWMLTGAAFGLGTRPRISAAEAAGSGDTGLLARVRETSI
jgi:O-antigen ligase